MRFTLALTLFLASSLSAIVPSHAKSLRRSIRKASLVEDSRSLQETQAPLETEAPSTLSTFAPNGGADPMVNPSKEGRSNSTQTTIALNGYENQLFAYLNYVRTAYGLQPFSLAIDAVKEGQRWAKQMAAVGAVSQRDPLTINLNPNWRALGETDAVKPDIRIWVSTDLQLRKLVADKNFNRVGFGVVPKGNVFYISVIFKAM